MDYEEMLRHVHFRTDQKPLIAKGLTIHTDINENEFKIGDQVKLTDTDNKERIGIITLILDQGVCLISDYYWMQIHSHMYKLWKWEHVTKVNTEFKINLV